jgi:DNA-binding transcriptional ArsR family regulator
MVNYQPAPLDRLFGALADPTRRALLARLEGAESVSVSELARPFPVSLPAVMKHLDVLAEAGLVAREKTGRTVACRLTAAPLQEAAMWIARYRRFWADRLDRLAEYLEEMPWPPAPVPPQEPRKARGRSSSPERPTRSRASRSSAASRRRPKKSTRRGRSRST